MRGEIEAVKKQFLQVGTGRVLISWVLAGVRARVEMTEGVKSLARSLEEREKRENEEIFIKNEGVTVLQRENTVEMSQDVSEPRVFGGRVRAPTKTM